MKGQAYHVRCSECRARFLFTLTEDGKSAKMLNGMNGFALRVANATNLDCTFHKPRGSHDEG